MKGERVKGKREERKMKRNVYGLGLCEERKGM